MKSFSMFAWRAFALFGGLLPIAWGQTAAGPIAPVRTSITVVEHVSEETPADITDLSGAQISTTTGANLDDRLRQVPGFSLFRRSSSVVANPTTQGISLRGIGSSGASRTLVLFDGIPMNDPFGGWVYWTRFTPEDVERVEVSRGASTSVFGNLAMGGAINIFPEEPTKRHVSAGYEAGTENTHDLWAGYTEAFRHFAITGAGRAFTTDGYYVVPESVRGAVDRRADVRFVNNTVRLDGFTGRQRLYAWFNSVEEERANGTYLTHNNTTIGTASLRYLYQGAHDSFAVTGFGSSGQFHSTFSSVFNNRNTEKLTDRQTVPEDSLGGSAIWTHATQRFDVSAGADADRAHGFSTDKFSPTNVKVGGGTILEHGEFVQTDLTAGPVRFFLGGRHQFTGQGHQFFSPSGGVAVGRGRWRARGSAYRAFRSPTLNELFRQFSVGNTVTRANPALQPETLLGAEVGGDYLMEKGAIRVTAFRNDLHGLITNVTLSSTKTQIVRERENAGNALSRGFEISADHRWANLSGQIGYLYAESRYVTGLLVPQVPRHQGSAMLTYSRGRTVASAGVRSYSSQFDDDQNRFLLPGFATMQVLLRERIGPGIFASLEMTNALDRVFYTGFTPTPTIGDPRLIRGGVLWRLP